MKKFLLVIAVIAAVFSNAAVAFAGPEEGVDIYVTIDKEVSIEIGGGPLDLGRMGIGGTKISASPITVKNNGSGANETITLSVTNPAGWTRGEPAAEQYKISFEFTTFDAVEPTGAWVTSVSEVIPYDGTKKLWVKFEAPTSTTVTTQQTIKLLISAE